MADDVEKHLGSTVASTGKDGTKEIDVISMLGRLAQAVQALDAKTDGGLRTGKNARQKSMVA